MITVIGTCTCCRGSRHSLLVLLVLACLAGFCRRRLEVAAAAQADKDSGLVAALGFFLSLLAALEPSPNSAQVAGGHQPHHAHPGKPPGP